MYSSHQEMSYFITYHLCAVLLKVSTYFCHQVHLAVGFTWPHRFVQTLGISMMAQYSVHYEQIHLSSFSQLAAVFIILTTAKWQHSSHCMQVSLMWASVWGLGLGGCSGGDRRCGRDGTSPHPGSWFLFICHLAVVSQLKTLKLYKDKMWKKTSKMLIYTVHIVGWTTVFDAGQCFLFQKFMYLEKLRNQLPTLSPLDDTWPEASPRFLQASQQLREMYHQWRVGQLPSRPSLT